MTDTELKIEIGRRLVIESATVIVGFLDAISASREEALAGLEALFADMRTVLEQQKQPEQPNREDYHS